MKTAEGFVLKNIAGTNVVLPTGSNTVSFRAVISLNETGAFLWEQLATDKTEDELVKALLSEYNTDEKTARHDISEFLGNMKEAGLLV